MCYVSVRSNNTRLRKILRSYPEVANYLLKKNATDQAIAKYCDATLRYMQQNNMTPQQYTKNRVPNSCKVAYVGTEETTNDIFIESVDTSILHSLRHHGAQNPQADLIHVSV